MKRSYYSADIYDFVNEDSFSVYGKLCDGHGFSLEEQQKNAWKRQIEILKNALKGLNGRLYFEFLIPRMGKRVDNILILGDKVFVLEFKVGDSLHQKHAIEQVLDYCLDLKNFHEGSHHVKLVPVLISTKAKSVKNDIVERSLIFDTLKCNEMDLRDSIDEYMRMPIGEAIDIHKWETAVYKPTPTIVEAAQALYRGHNVQEISRNDAGAINLSGTTNCINQVIDKAKQSKQKAICFLTGVPGAGKTLAGLNIANERLKADEQEHAVFLSGNGPLVEVLREALTRDEVVTSKRRGVVVTKKEAAIKANAFIQNIHHFRDDNLISQNAPTEKVVVFDEAQRAWAKEQVSGFMKRKKGVDNFDMSEPEFLISVMDRHEDWCCIVCLIGGGQEINTGEAGVSEWLMALRSRFKDWAVYYSSLIVEDPNYLAQVDLIDWIRSNGTEKGELHLEVSLRSFRSEKLSKFVQSILSLDKNAANSISKEVLPQFPVVLTRSWARAKEWLYAQKRGSEKIGVVASSGGKRLRPIGIDVKNEIDAPIWFLNDKSDVRSSDHLEDVATEFDIQGLEIDWVCLAWDVNFYCKNGQWHFRSFKGTKWNNLNQVDSQSYLLNAYRVLLTRARQGLIIFVPEGDCKDVTRQPDLYNSTYDYLKECGIPELDMN